MANGATERNARRIQESFDADLARARDLQVKGNVLEAARSYQFAIRDFAGLADVGPAKSELADLDSKVLREAEREEAGAISQQAQLIEDAS